MPMTTESWVGNGIDGASGGYLRPPLDAAQLTENLALGGFGVPSLPRMPLPDIDPDDLSSAGWGIVLPEGLDPAIREALAPLLELRRETANGGSTERYRELTYYSGETKNRFLVRHGVGPGPVMPDRMPYYLLLVGGPEAIPFDVQDELSVQYAIGRLDLDYPEDYARYARAVVTGSERAPRRQRRTVVFAPANPDDRPTLLTRRYLAQPLASELASRSNVDSLFENAACKQGLARTLGSAPPDLLFVASHGMGFDAGHERQGGAQGALLCQDWRGPLASRGPVSADHYFAGADLDPAADLEGLIACFFACYSAGTPRMSRFPRPGEAYRPLAPKSFVADLPRRLLSHPGGAALAVIGRVDRAWGYSFLWAETQRTQIETFMGALGAILDGRRVGWALECFAQRYSEITVALFMAMERSRESEVPADEIASLWTAARDARGWMLLGDPAVRLGSRST